MNIHFTLRTLRKRPPARNGGCRRTNSIAAFRGSRGSISHPRSQPPSVMSSPLLPTVALNSVPITLTQRVQRGTLSRVHSEPGNMVGITSREPSPLTSMDEEQEESDFFGSSFNSSGKNQSISGPYRDPFRVGVVGVEVGFLGE